MSETFEPQSGGKLVDALDGGGDGSEILIEKDAMLDVTGYSFSNFPHNVTIRSKSDEPRSASIIRRDRPDGDELTRGYGNAEIRNINLLGPERNVVPNEEENEYGGLFLLGERAKVVGCSFSGWPVAGLLLGSMRNETDAEVRDTRFEYCLNDEYGYGIQHYNGSMLAQGNYFNHTRHAIASFGYPTCHYIARRNVVGPYTLSHAFDSHNLAENRGGRERVRDLGFNPDVAGGRIIIEWNDFQFTHDMGGNPQEAIAVRGIPDQGVVIARNRFAHRREPDPPGGQGSAFRQQMTDGGWERVFPFENEYGVEF